MPLTIDLGQIDLDPTWESIADKPFTSLGQGLVVNDGILTIDETMLGGGGIRKIGELNLSRDDLLYSEIETCYNALPTKKMAFAFLEQGDKRWTFFQGGIPRTFRCIGNESVSLALWYDFGGVEGESQYGVSHSLLGVIESITDAVFKIYVMDGPWDSEDFGSTAPPPPAPKEYEILVQSATTNTGSNVSLGTKSAEDIAKWADPNELSYSLYGLDVSMEDGRFYCGLGSVEQDGVRSITPDDFKMGVTNKVMCKFDDLSTIDDEKVLDNLLYLLPKGAGDWT